MALRARGAASGPWVDCVALSCRSSRNMGRELTYLCTQPRMSTASALCRPKHVQGLLLPSEGHR